VAQRNKSAGANEAITITIVPNRPAAGTGSGATGGLGFVPRSLHHSGGRQRTLLQLSSHTGPAHAHDGAVLAPDPSPAAPVGVPKRGAISRFGTGLGASPDRTVLNGDHGYGATSSSSGGPAPGLRDRVRFEAMAPPVVDEADEKSSGSDSDDEKPSRPLKRAPLPRGKPKVASSAASDARTPLLPK